MEQLQYTPRIVDGQLAGLMDAMWAVVIEGPKGCGKTMTALLSMRSSSVLTDADVTDSGRRKS